MIKLYIWSRRCAAIATTGMLFQAGGCTVAGQNVTAIFLANTLQNLVGTVVFSSFNLIP